MYVTSFLPGSTLRDLQRLRIALSNEELRSLLQKTGEGIGVAALSVISDYPPPSGKPLPLIHTRIVTAVRPYVATDGSRRISGMTYRSKFKSAKQQGYVMALIAANKPKARKGKTGGKAKSRAQVAKRGAGTFPYKRTGTLGKSLLYEVKVFARAGYVTVVIGSNLGYAPFVLDKAQQAEYHKGTWTPIQDDLDNNRTIIEAEGIKAFQKAVKQILDEARK